MCIGYSEVPQRLFQYRKRLGITQSEMGEKLGVNQSHYCKLESGDKTISFESLKKFEEQGGDVLFVLTGKEKRTGRMDEYLAGCRTVYGKTEMVKMLLWAMRLGIWMSREEERSIPDIMIRSVELASEESKRHSLWENIREVEGLSQRDMCREINVDIKRYRRIERDETKPDALILHTVYNRFQYSPSLFLGYELFCTDELNEMWERFSTEVKMCLEPVIENTCKLIRICEESE